MDETIINLNASIQAALDAAATHADVDRVISIMEKGRADAEAKWRALRKLTADLPPKYVLSTES